MANHASQYAGCKKPRSNWPAVLSFVLTTLSLAGAAEIDSLIRSAPAHDAYPEAGALILLDRKVVTVDRNNNPTTERYLVVKIFEDRGRDDFGDITQRFNKDGQVVEVLEARTHTADGRAVKPEPRAIAEVSAPEVADAMAYTNAMLKVVSFPALEPDAVIEYRVRVKPKKGTKEDGFSGAVRFGGKYPALKREFRLVVPKGAVFKSAWSQAGVEPAVETLQTQISHTWTVTSTPQIFDEPGMPDMGRLVPVLSYSSYQDWKAVATRLRKEFDKGRAGSPAVKRLSDSLAAGRTGAEALKAIYLYVTQKIRNVHLDYGQAGHEAHKTPDIIAWKYGDCRDKNRLLICLLAAQGIAATPVALSYDQVPVPSDVPSPDAFDWLATVVFLSDTSSGQSEIENRQSPIFLDPFAEYVPYGTIPAEEAGASALYLSAETEDLFTVPLSGRGQRDVAITKAELSLELNGDLSGTVTTGASGFYDEQLREDWRDQTPTDRQRTMAMTASGIRTGARIDSFWFSDLHDLTRPARAGFRFSAPRYAVTQKGELSMRAPSPAVVGDPLFGITTSPRRTNPVWTPPARTYAYTCNVKLPPGVKVDILPDSVAVSDTCGSSEGGWARTEDGVSFYYTLRLVKPGCSLPEFPRLKAAVDAVFKPQFREVYFLK